MCALCGTRPVGRRRFLAAPVALAASLATLPVHAQPAPTTLSPDEVLQRLVRGNARYAANQPLARDPLAGRAERVLGQAPVASILGCADSRVDPERVFDEGPGDLFIVRVAGNYVTPYGLASLEYGAAVLGTKLIMVLGHDNCGAIGAALKALEKGNSYPGHIADLVRAIKPGILAEARKPGPDLPRRATIENIRYNVARLKQATPLIDKMVAKGSLKIAGGIYDLATGQVSLV